MLTYQGKIAKLLICLNLLVGVGTACASERTNEYPARMAAIEEMRHAYRSMIPQAGIGEPIESYKDIVIQADNPAREIPLRIYFPLQAKKRSKLPVFLFMHGGGFVSGDLDTHDVLLRAITNGADCIVVSVGYRLAPENPFPAGLEDNYAALLWVKDRASELGADGAKIVVGGDSAGGNLAVALALLVRDRKGPLLLGQWLMYPTLSNKLDTESWAKLGNQYYPTRDVQQTVISAYVPDGINSYDPLIEPLYAILDNLPVTLIQVGELDPLIDEGRDFAQKLEQSGNQAEFLAYPELQHGFLQFYQDEKSFPGAFVALEQGLTWLKKTFSAVD